MEKVSAVKCESYDLDDVYLTVKEALKRIDFTFPENKTVLIKPNVMSQNRPEQHTITHYSIIDALCRLLKERNCKIQIGESIAFYQEGLTMAAFETAKILEVADKYGVSLVAFEKEPLVAIRSNLVGLKELFIPQVLLDADLVINVCKLKTHATTRLSGAVKNMFGCLPGGYKQKIHILVNNEFELSDVFIDIHNVVKPALSIMDAIVSLDGGPSAIGKPVKTKRLLASVNAAAADVVACRMIGYEPTDIPTLICAKKRQMIKDFDDIQILGEIIPVKFKNLIKGDLDKPFDKNSIFVRNTYVDVFIVQEKCTKCKKCIAPCPVGAIKEYNDKIAIDTGLCINCYHCLFVCPDEAIKIKPSIMNKLIRAIRFVLKI